VLVRIGTTHWIDVALVDWPPPSPFVPEPFDRGAIRKVVAMLGEATSAEEYARSRDVCAARYGISPHRLMVELEAACPETSREHKQ